MRKIYSIITLMVFAAVSIAATAQVKTFTVKVDDPARIILRDPANSYQPVVFDSNNQVLMSFEGSAPVQAADGYQLESVTNSAGTSVDSYTSFPAAGANIETSRVEDGDVVTIVTAEKELKVFTVIANPDHISKVEYNYVTYNAVDGKYTIPCTYDWGSMAIYLNDGYKFRSITDESGTSYDSYGNPYISIYCGSFSTNKTFTVDSYSAAEARTAKMTVNVTGNASDISFQRADNTYITLDGASTEVAFDPQGEAPMTIAHQVYNKSIYNVTVDKGSIEKQGSRYILRPDDGAVVDIAVDYPDKDIPVNVIFNGEGIDDIVTSFTSNGTNVSKSEWSAPGFTMKLGSSLYMGIDYTNYENVSVTVNGQNVSFPMSIDDVEKYDIVISGTKMKGYDITVLCGDWENVVIKGNGVTYPLTGEETQLEIPKAVYSLQISAINDYVISGVYDAETSQSLNYSYGYLYNLADGMQILIEADKYNRDNLMMVYLEENVSWSYGSSMYLARGQEVQKEVVLTPGYNEVCFNVADLTSIQLSCPWGSMYSTPAVYLNDEQLADQYGGFPGLSEIKDGDIVKIYQGAKDPHSVTYEIEADINVEIRHDHINAISNPSVHSVLPGTQIHIEAARSRASSTGVVVSVNDTQVEPDADGVYSIIADGDKNISVKKDLSAGIDEVGADEANAPVDVYNAQGILVIKGVAPDQIKNLPAGLYIAGGKKIIVK